jgi:membrane protease YdiL (CAAX protease family)
MLPDYLLCSQASKWLVLGTIFGAVATLLCFALLHLDAKLFHVGAYVDGLVYLHQPTNCG